MGTNGRKICMFLLNPYITDGRVRRTCRYLSSNGHEITVIAESPSGKDDELETDGVRVIRLDTSGLPTSKGRFIKYNYRAAVLGAQANADIYHAFDLDALAPASFAALINRGKLIYESHEYYTGLEALNGRPITRFIWNMLERLLIYRADRVITINGSIADKLASFYSIPNPEIIYSCADFHSEGSAGSMREKLGIPEGRMVLVYIGVLRPGQGLEILIDAVKDVEDVVLLILGDGPLKALLVDKIEKYGITDKIIFREIELGMDVKEYLSSADAGVLIMEPVAENNRMALPNKFFSYLAAGLPVIVSDMPELKYFTEKYELGLVVDADAECTREAIELFIEAPGVSRRYGKNALEFSKEFTWESQARKYLYIYKEVLDD
ncbi:MAG: glycosyltransferase [candidate division Zixibacteria bacterium]|nr:glycosyltransferase [candidate division Zixibacteria bacterium]